MAILVPLLSFVDHSCFAILSSLSSSLCARKECRVHSLAVVRSEKHQTRAQMKVVREFLKINGIFFKFVWASRKKTCFK